MTEPDPNSPDISASKILRHEAAEFQAALPNADAAELILEHIEKWVGHPDQVFHEMLSDAVHVDVHVVSPTPERNYYTLVTSGMSDLPMDAPEHYSDYRYAELVMCLPPTWPLFEAKTDDNNWDWPVTCLRYLARFPHKYNTWLFATHTVPNGDPAQPFSANTKFSCVLIEGISLLPDEFATLTFDDEKTVHFLAVIPIYDEETEYKLQFGSAALVEKLGEIGVTELVDINRQNVCTLQ